MAYLVSQLRKDSGTEYAKEVNYQTGIMTSPNNFGEKIQFQDFAILPLNSSGESTTFSPDLVYFFRFKINQIPQYYYSGSKTAAELPNYSDADVLSLQIILKNNPTSDLDKNNPPEVIGSCIIPVATNAVIQEEGQDIYTSEGFYNSYSFVFKPTQSFGCLGLRVNRVSYDAIYASNDPRNWLILTVPLDGITKNVFNGSNTKIFVRSKGERIIIQELSILKNIIPSDVKNGFLKFGYQSRPGSLIVVNGLPIRVGRSGIYEINNGTVITKFMIASPNGTDANNIDAFLLDYAYKNS